MDKSEIFLRFITILTFGLIMFGIVLVIYNAMEEAEDLMKHCQANGYDGIKWEEVNFMKDTLVCTNFTHAEKVKMEFYEEKNGDWDDTAKDVLGALIGKDSGGTKNG